MPPSNWPLELQALIGLLRQVLGTAQDGEALPPPDTPKLAPWVTRHRVGALLHQRLPATAREPLDPEFGAWLQKVNLATTQRTLVRTAALGQLAAVLDAASIPWLNVKGALLSEQLWGAAHIRHAGDLDLAVPLNEVSRADALIRSQNFRRILPDRNLSPRQEIEFRHLKHEYGYRHRERPGLHVELKWRIDGLPEDMWPPSVDTPLLDQTIPVLPPALNFRYLCHHGARHGWFRLFWLVDIARLLHLDTTPWAEVLPEGANDLGYRPVAQAVHLAHKLLGAPVPPGLLPAVSAHESRIVDQLCHEALRQMANPTPHEGGTGAWFRQLRYRAHLQPGRRGWREATKGHLNSPLNWLECPLPDRWFWLYRPLSPLLWLYRLTRRRAGGS